MEKVNLAQKLALFQEYWSPKIVGELNGQFVKLVKFKGDFLWHQHEDEDELFLVLHGKLIMNIRDQEDIVLNEGEFFIVPRKMEHKPFAQQECHVLLFEPETTLNTGDKKSDRTVKNLKKI